MQKHWNILPLCPTETQAVLDVGSPILAQLLWNRGIRTKTDAEMFLHPSWDAHLHPASQFRHMAQAVARVFQALETDERITVHGDYDADGVSGSAILITTLREIKQYLLKTASYPATADDAPFNIDAYIPHRDKEGYGLHSATVSHLHARGTRLLITVDCGIMCQTEIREAKSLGIDTIIVDHHAFNDCLPEAYLIHPGLPDETYPFPHLAAVGVAFKLATCLLDEARAKGLPIPPGREKWLLDLVAIATVTDMVPLMGENRVLETYGLTVLNQTRRPGLLTLIKQTGLSLGSMDTESIGFGLGPRINAAGRMRHASLALRLLLAQTEEEATNLAQEVEICNRERQERTRRMLEEAEEQFAHVSSAERIIVLWDERWPPALVGLVAGKFLEKYGKPVIAIGQHEGIWIGSGRSPTSFDVTEAVRTSGHEKLARVGGHRQACGFTLSDPQHLTAIREQLYAYANEHASEIETAPILDIDARVSLNDVDWPLVKQCEFLHPFGQGNPRPVFVACARVLAVDLIGQTQNHTRLILQKPQGGQIKALGFKQPHLAALLPPGTEAEIAFHIMINTWNGRQTVEARLVDARPALPPYR